MSVILESFMIFLVTVSWSCFSALSETCENGEWPISWSNPHILSNSMISLSKFSLVAILFAKNKVPIECSNLVWFAPGYTRFVNPNCFILLL